MKRAAGTFLVFIVLFFAADAFRAWLLSLLEGARSNVEAGSWFTDNHNYVYAGMLVYSVPFVIAGAIMACRTSSLGLGCLLSGLLGISVTTLHALYDGGIQPLIYFTHAPRWFEPLFWSNLYMPVMGSLVGALAWAYLGPRTQYAKNAA
jgi:hypothetical protein